MHINEFIDDPESDSYASWFFVINRFGASLREKVNPHSSKYNLFCDYRGDRYRVTGSSTMGDIFLTSNLDQIIGCTIRVMVDQCENWSDTP